ncbi:MAG: DUF4440 domain-containing protein [Planctomycetes bacterium]|jgi:hypothetical protein|nr:DUF4440 domain-containing protein [Phycisphaerae bacterium]NBB94328.1 DUF4440 domain-containing protein [Planctomycetota bacterium]
MEAIHHALFGDPTSVYVALAIVEVLLGVAWFYRRTAKLQRLLVLPILLAGGVFVLDQAIVTDREQLGETVESMAEDFVAGRLDAIGRYIDDGYVGFRGASKAELLEAIHNEGRVRNVTSIDLSGVEIDVSGNLATMWLVSTITVDGSMYSGSVALHWQLRWVKRGDVWRLEYASEPKRGISGFGI